MPGAGGGGAPLVRGRVGAHAAPWTLDAITNEPIEHDVGSAGYFSDDVDLFPDVAADRGLRYARESLERLEAARE